MRRGLSKRFAMVIFYYYPLMVRLFFFFPHAYKLNQLFFAESKRNSVKAQEGLTV